MRKNAIHKNLTGVIRYTENRRPKHLPNRPTASDYRQSSACTTTCSMIISYTAKHLLADLYGGNQVSDKKGEGERGHRYKNISGRQNIINKAKKKSM
jgi:hypothetical protein